MAKPEITRADFLRFLEVAGIETLDNEEWMEKNRLSREVIDDIGTQMAAGVIGRCLIHGEDLGTALYNVVCTCFQMGWEAHKEFGNRKC